MCSSDAPDQVESRLAVCFTQRVFTPRDVLMDRLRPLNFTSDELRANSPSSNLVSDGSCLRPLLRIFLLIVSFFYDVTKSHDVMATEHGYGSLYFFCYLSRIKFVYEALAASQQRYFERTMEQYMARIDASDMEWRSFVR